MSPALPKAHRADKGGEQSTVLSCWSSVQLQRGYQPVATAWPRLLPNCGRRHTRSTAAMRGNYICTQVARRDADDECGSARASNGTHRAVWHMNPSRAKRLSTIAFTTSWFA